LVVKLIKISIIPTKISITPKEISHLKANKSMNTMINKSINKFKLPSISKKSKLFVWEKVEKDGKVLEIIRKIVN
jgi:DNA-directed RNA polymerase subunit H (RpoH/RPB5)